MKKIWIILLIGIMILGTTACTNQPSQGTGNQAAAQESNNASSDSTNAPSSEAMIPQELK